MDFIYHGNCLDGAFSVSLFLLAFKIMRNHSNLEDHLIIDLFMTTKNLPKVEAISQIQTDFPSGRLKKEIILNYPQITQTNSQLRFHEVKLTNYNKCFQNLLSQFKDQN